MCLCECMSPSLFILKRGDIKTAAGLCGLVTISSINWLAYFRATLPQADLNLPHTHIIHSNTHLLKAQPEIGLCQMFCSDSR